MAIQISKQPYFSPSPAGTNTITTTLHWAVGLMTKHPDIQEQVAQEVDDVIGRDRIPSLEDFGKLPYTEAAIHEVLRFSSAVPLGVPHTTMEDTTLGKAKENYSDLVSIGKTCF